VPTSRVKRIVGAGGATIKEIQKKRKCGGVWGGERGGGARPRGRVWLIRGCRGQSGGGGCHSARVGVSSTAAARQKASEADGAGAVAGLGSLLDWTPLPRRRPDCAPRHIQPPYAAAARPLTRPLIAPGPRRSPPGRASKSKRATKSSTGPSASPRRRRRRAAAPARRPRGCSSRRRPRPRPRPRRGATATATPTATATAATAATLAAAR
jgi:hypothetical protein